MKHIELSPGPKAVTLRAGIEKVLPNCTDRSGGPDSEDHQLCNEKVASMLKVPMLPDGTAAEFE